MPSAGRAPQPSAMVVGGYVAYAAVGWFLSGLGAVLPELETEIGQRSALYQVLPGVMLLVWGVGLARRQHRPRAAVRHARDLGLGSAVLAAAVGVMGVTAWFAVSAVGAVVAAIAAAWMIGLLPAALAIARPADTERVMMRANAWSSLAGIAAPLSIGASIALGLGWLAGMEVLLVVGAVVVPLTARAARPAPGGAAAERRTTAVPPLRDWWAPWTVLWLSIVLEFCFAYYAATFLHDEVGLSSAAAAAGASAWAIGMTGGRFVVSTWTPPRSFAPTLVLVMIGFVLLWGFATPVAAIVGIGLAGLGVAPLYPTRATALLDRFPAAPDQGSTRAAISSGAALVGAPALMALVRSLSDVRTAYLVVPVLIVVLGALDRTSRATAPG